MLIDQGAQALLVEARDLTGDELHAGDVEVHDKTHHIVIIVEGEATFVTGGTLVGAKNTAPGQIRAASLTGGQTHQLKKGDVITIPAKTPHWWKDVPTKTIAYYAINTEP